MAGIEVRFERYCFQRKPGDRSLHTVDCYLFKIMINGFKTAEFNQYEPWMEHVGNYAETYKEARKYADGLADVFNAERPVLVEMIKEEVKTVEWVRGKVVEGTEP